MAHPMANGMQSFEDVKPEEQDDHKIADESDAGDAGCSLKCKKQKHHPDEGDAGCSPKFKKQKHHPDEDQVDDDDKSDDVAVNQVAAVQ